MNYLEQQKLEDEILMVNEKRENEGELQMLRIITTLGLKLLKDGNKFCYLYGDDLQTGVAGFGDTPMEAVTSFNNNFMKGKA